jgi:hypothetical protein
LQATLTWEQTGVGRGSRYLVEKFLFSREDAVFLRSNLLSATANLSESAVSPGEASVCSTSTGPVVTSVTSMTGSASRVGLIPPPGKDGGAQIRIGGKFEFAGPVRLGSSTVTITSVLGEYGPGGIGELVEGTDGADILPFAVAARRGGNPDAATFETPSRAIPKFRMEMRARGQGVFDVLLKIDRASISVFPKLCAGDSDPATNLTTSFAIDDGTNPPVGVATTEAWRCLDLIGGDPQKPRSLRVP